MKVLYFDLFTLGYLHSLRDNDFGSNSHVSVNDSRPYINLLSVNRRCRILDHYHDYVPPFEHVKDKM